MADTLSEKPSNRIVEEASLDVTIHSLQSFYRQAGIMSSSSFGEDNSYSYSRKNMNPVLRPDGSEGPDEHTKRFEIDSKNKVTHSSYTRAIENGKPEKMRIVYSSGEPEISLDEKGKPNGINANTYITAAKEKGVSFKATFDEKGEVIKIIDRPGNILSSKEKPNEDLIKEAKELRKEATTEAAKNRMEESSRLQKINPELHKKLFPVEPTSPTALNAQQAVNTARTV